MTETAPAANQASNPAAPLTSAERQQPSTASSPKC